MKPKEIVFFGHFGTQNLGNECTLQAIICNTLKRLPDAGLKCLCTVPEDTAARHHISASGLLAESPTWIEAANEASHNSRAKIVSTRGEISGPAVGQTLNMGDEPKEYGFLAKWLRRLFFKIPIELLHWANGFWLLRGSHMLIVPGTNIVSDYLTGPFGWAYDIFKWSIIAKLCQSQDTLCRHRSRSNFPPIEQVVYQDQSSFCRIS